MANRAAALGPFSRGPLGESLPGILQQEPRISVDDHQRMLVVIHTEVDESLTLISLN
jgi:hypothetical protein